jgi:twitching motility two-component system response regulator PilG
MSALQTKHNLMLAEAVTAAKLGQRPLARRMLNEIIEQDPRNENAWLWIAALSETGAEGTLALERVLEINPNNQKALNALAVLRLKESGRMFAAKAAPMAPKPEAPPREMPEPEAHAAVAADEQEPVPALEAKNYCPVCEGEYSGDLRICQRCGSLMGFASLDEYAGHKSVNEDLLYEAIRRLSAHLEREETPDLHWRLALAYLNLNRSAEALPHLNRAEKLRPGDGCFTLLAKALSDRRLILAVDDSLTVRKIVSITLERKGYRVLTAADGMQALAKLNDQMPDLVLLDITMPRMDGYQVCKVIKQNPFTKNIPVVMLSGKDGFFDKVKGKLAGATDYITKPFRETTLEQTIHKYLPVK